MPVHDGAIAKARWEVELEQQQPQPPQVGGFNPTATTTTLQTEIAL